ncbi:MAG: hypothetical protein JW941_05050 [Candidatus Coatesbacteria bacterium]|nr:hypothetical protein [Candidatus Coatesbacteria bacterium]
MKENNREHSNDINKNGRDLAELKGAHHLIKEIFIALLAAGMGCLLTKSLLHRRKD